MNTDVVTSTDDQPRSPVDDRGETLLELMVAITVAAIAIVAIIGGMALAIAYSDVHRKQAAAGTNARDFGEALLTKVATGGYVPCATPADYLNTTPRNETDRFTYQITSIRYWSNNTWSTADPAACASGNLDEGLQQVSFEVSYTNATKDAERAVEPLVVVLRKPCTPEEPTCS